VIRSYATGRSFFQSSNPLRRYQHNQIAGESASINAFEVSGTIPHLGKGVQIGQVATTTRIYSVLDVESFASCVQDHNPIHSAMDWETAVNSDAFWKIYQQNKMIEFNDSSQGKITKPIVHGMLVSSIFSSIFASLSPGCIYMNQTLSFENPVYVNDKVVGKIEIEKIRKWRKGGVVVQCKTEAFVLQDEKVQDGTMAAMSQDELHLVNRIAVKGTANVWLPSGYKS
jgi:acyl dehydratase